MRVKSRYRQQFKDGGRIDAAPPEDFAWTEGLAPPEQAIAPVADASPAPAVEQPPAPQAEPVAQQPEPQQQPATPQATPPAAPPPETDASLALAKQIANLRRSEQLQQQHLQQQAMAMANAEAHRQEWLNKTPGARDHIAKLGAFHHAALKAGLADTSPEYFQFLETQLAALKAAPPSPPQPTPQFQPPPAAKPPKPLYGAPVSREVPTSNGSRPTGKVTLSPAEVEAARISGISAEEYAKEKLRYRNMLQSGEYRDNRGEGG